MRSGTRSQCKEKWTPKGQRPHCPLKLGYEYCYLYAAINPYRGELFCLLLPDMTKESFTVFNQHFCVYLDARYAREQRPPVLLVADGAGPISVAFVSGAASSSKPFRPPRLS